MFHFICVFIYSVWWGCTAHLFTCEINVDYKELRTAIYEFAWDNKPWIEKVSRDALVRAKLTAEDFIKGLHNNTLLFDELYIIITCWAFNLHCVILLDGAYWSTHPNNGIQDCLIKIVMGKQ